MLTALRNIYDLLSVRERRRGFLLLCMILVMALLDMIGVASVMPFMAVLANPGIVESNTYLSAVYETLGFEDAEAFLFFLGIVVLLALVGANAFKALTTYALLRFTHMRNYSLSRRLVEGYLRQPYDWFLNRHSADLGKSILSEVGQIVNGAVIPAMQILAYGAVVATLLALLIAVDPLLTTIVIAGLGSAYAVAYLSLRRYLARIGKDRLAANRERFQIIQETFGGIKDVKVSGLERVLVKRFDGPAKRFARREAASQVASQLPRFALEAFAFGAILMVALYLMGGPGGLQQTLPVLAVYAVAGYRLMPALQQIYAQFVRLRFAAPALASLHADLTAVAGHGDSDSGSTSQSGQALGLNDGVKVQGVSYTYPGAARPALDGISLEIAARKTVGLVGATGSGKTTLADIILALLSPEHGELIVDGSLITPENVRAWQRTIGYVPQHIYLADDTVAANIAFGTPQAEVDLDAVVRAAYVANLHDFVVQEMPKGYETLVGERGARLSGGQRQRIGIARALYRDPDVLIMDEATSALDTLTEQAVMDAVRNLGHRKTIVLIAHRLSTVKACDQIFLLGNGRLLARGTFDELVKTNTHFRAMAANYG